MKARFVIDLEAPRAVVDQMRRSGFSVMQDGSALRLQVPNRQLDPSASSVAYEPAPARPRAGPAPAPA